jgi:hypothetical protein
MRGGWNATLAIVHNHKLGRLASCHDIAKNPQVAVTFCHHFHRSQGSRPERLIFGSMGGWLVS